MKKTQEELETQMVANLFRDVIRQAPKQRQHELQVLAIKFGFIALILLGATWLTLNGNFSQDIIVALYVAVLGYILGTIR